MSPMMESIRTWSDRDDPWVMSGEYQNVISPGISTMDKQRWPMGDEWRVSECDQPWVINDGQTRWPMGDEWRVSECDQPWVTNDGQTEMTHGWWVESIRMWSALGYQRWTNRDDPWVMSGEYQNVISPGLPTMDKQRWPMGDEWRVSECDQTRWTNRDDPWVMSGEYQNVISPGLSTMDKQRWPMGDEWRVLECDQPWVINDGQTEMTHGWWVESIRMWSALGYQRWTNEDDPWVMSGEYQNVISPGLSNDGQTEMTHGWWVESIRMWSALGYVNDGQTSDDPWVESIRTWLTLSMGNLWSRVDKQITFWYIHSSPMCHEWRVSEWWSYSPLGEYQGWHDGQTHHPWVDLWWTEHGWWVESIRMWSLITHALESIPGPDWYTKCQWVDLCIRTLIRPRADQFWWVESITHDHLCLSIVDNRSHSNGLSEHDQTHGSLCLSWVGWWVESIRTWSDPWMSGEYQNMIRPTKWWVESIRMWSALGYQRWTNRDDPWVMSGEYQNVISPGISTMDKQRWPMGDEWRVSECDQPWVINDGQTEMTHGWWVESIRMWSALGYQRWTNRDDPWVMSGEYQNVISPGLSTMDKQRWPMGDEWRVSECDQPWVINDGQTEMTHGWWVESIRMWSALGYQRWTNRDDPWVMSGEYQNVISPDQRWTNWNG